MNRLHRMHLATVSLPDTHPRADEGRCDVFGFVIDTPDGAIVIDTGPRAGHPLIDELYAPVVTPIATALHGLGIDERDVVAIVNTHLHFDHCGQNAELPNAQIWVSQAELEAAATEFYTVPDWAEVSPVRRRVSTDGEALVAGVTIMHTPGHTPGHQSVMLETEVGSELIVGQCCYSCGEFADGRPAATDMHDADWLAVGQESLDRLRALRPRRAHFSHDARVFDDR